MLASDTDQRVLIWASGRDGSLTCDFLRKSGFQAWAFSDGTQYCAEIRAGAGVLIVAEEFLSHPESGTLRVLLETQSAWSDIPVVIVAQRETEAGLSQILDDYGGVSVLHRPLSLDTLCSTIGAALRARRRQYQVRDLLNQREETDRRRAEFLAMLAHELRNPLSPIRTGLQVLRLAESKELLERTHTMIERQVQNLSRLINDLLDVSRVTRGTIQLNRTVVDVGQVLSQVAEARWRSAIEKGLTLEVCARGERAICVNADAMRVEQMVDNVLSNAIKFTPAGGRVTLQVIQEAEEAVIRVRDSGIGIPSDMLESVFELFAQTPRTLDRTEGGLGIGLTVVRTLAELHGGSVKAFSEGENKGTEIVIRLPGVPEESGPAKVLAAASQTPARRVLLVEDHHDTADLLATYLRCKGHTVYVAYDGAKGYEMAVRERPEVIICDVGLPGMDGYELAGALTKAAVLQGCRLVAVTGYGEARDKDRALKAGFQYHLVKPADPAEIERLLMS
jgi:signal transduction histidine kinase